MKKTILLLGVILVLGIALGVGQFWWSQLRGVGPAFRQPETPITDLLPTSTPPDGTDQPAVPVNTTDMPLKLLPNFSISIFAKGLGSPRVMAYDSAGRIITSITSAGKVLTVRDADGDGSAEQVTTLLAGLRKPHGLMFICDPSCKLYVAEENAVSVYDYDDKAPAVSNKKKILDLPTGGRHFTRTIMQLPYPEHERFLISIGSSCDVCHEDDARRGAIYSAKLDGTDFKQYAKGLRNSVFMAIHPVDGNVWATDMGRDYLGDNLPPDEINIIREGTNYGWPVCYGKNVHDDVFDKNTYIRNPCMEPFETPSHIDLQAHSAPLGIAFVPEEGWPQDYWYDALVAYHGSWNKSEPTGFKIVRFDLNEKGEMQGPAQDFITGWLPGANAKAALGRPADILIQPGGTMFVSDDKAGVIYRVLYRPTSRIANPASMVQATNLKPNDTIASPLTVRGQARGNWYFEASFPVKVTDANGTVLGTGIAQAQGEWMTEDFVPFEAKVEFTPPAQGNGYVELHRDNPSGLPENDAHISIPIQFKR